MENMTIQVLIKSFNEVFQIEVIQSALSSKSTSITSKKYLRN